MRDARETDFVRRSRMGNLERQRLVLVITSASEGRDGTTMRSTGMTSATEPTTATQPTPTGQVTNSTTFRTNTNSSVNSTTLTPTLTTEKGKIAGQTSTATTSATLKTTAPIRGGTSSSAGYVILGLMIVVIIILVIILLLFRRASRTYSFDLHRPSPAAQSTEPTGTFDPIYLDDRDMLVVEPETELAPSAVPNGTSGQEQVVEQNPNGTTVSNPAPDDITAEKTSSLLDDGDLLLDLDEPRPVAEQNNNPLCATDPLEEVTLDEPVCSDPLAVDFSSVVDILDSSPCDFSEP
ncbi:uncharacterized protein LOC128755785 isoform X2 [Synchiropus splendidus]|uniref:uncharacterized protein LOC128755785 isoform X2 n=1 Tax=Synchiropus splendidus TaxID=270530 RepID=UPI00237D7C63|nr:uncharacterized protein LOC128755785 isoform X2 [Synchiropus splendidus]